MTEIDDRPESRSAEPAQRRFGGDRRIWYGIAALVVIAAAAFAVWWFLIRDDSAAAVTSQEAAEARADALEAAAGDTRSDDPAAAPNDAAEGLDGTWSIDSTIGTFDDRCLTEVCDTTFVGFRIDEELATLGAKTVVGRTPGVEGSLVISGTTITETSLKVDMSQLITDSGSRTSAIRSQAIETGTFPEATFVLSEPIELGELPADGAEIDVDAVGELTIHGVTRTETIPLTAQLAGGVIVVFGELGPILLADYDIDKPSAAVVLSVEDNAIMELQLYFRHS